MRTRVQKSKEICHSERSKESAVCGESKADSSRLKAFGMTSSYSANSLSVLITASLKMRLFSSDTHALLRWLPLHYGQQFPVAHDHTPTNHNCLHIAGFQRVGDLRIDTVHRHSVWLVQTD